MQEKKAIAIFGGSFNPPLNSHIILAKEVINKFTLLEKVIFVPVSIRYGKKDLISDDDRYNMLKLICNKESKLEVSDIELKSNQRLYTIQTLDIFRRIYKQYDVYFIMGTDNLKELETWKEAERILTEYKIIALERGNDNLNKIIDSNHFLKAHKQSIKKIEGMDKMPCSATIIRKKIKNRENVKKFVDEEILKYIEKNKLYI